MAQRTRVYSPDTSQALIMLGRQISTERRARHRTQADIAERAGISVPTLIAIEKGSPSSGIGTVFEVAYLLGIPLVAAAEGANRALIDTRFALLPGRIVTPKDDDNDF